MSSIPEEGKVLLIDKELHWTSFDVVKKIRRACQIRKVGHAGTLDPLATGLLIVCLGKKTKEINQYMDMEKEYTGTLVLGKTTPSVDLETAFDSETSTEHLKEHDILNQISIFSGFISQKPPLFSAIKKDGSPLYLKARKGLNVEIEPRLVESKIFEITGISIPEIHFRLVCSKGFYVRSLVRDFGEALQVGAYLKTLRRTRIGEFSVDKAIKIDELDKLMN